MASNTTDSVWKEAYSVIFPQTNKASLRACLTCKLIRPVGVFNAKSCPNCPEFHDEDLHATPNFEGMVGIFNPQRSWVAASIGCTVKAKTPGMYAMRLDNKVTEGGEEEGEEEGEELPEES